MNYTKIDELDSQSEAVRDFIDQIPNWLIRWGITVIFLAVLGGIFLSWLIHYPTIVVSSFRLTTQNAPKPIVSRIDSRIVRIFINDNQSVMAGQTLAYLESTSNHAQVLKLINRLKNYNYSLVMIISIN